MSVERIANNYEISEAVLGPMRLIISEIKFLK